MTLSRRQFIGAIMGGRPVATSPITYDQPVLTHAGHFYRQPALTGQPPHIDRHVWTLNVQHADRQGRSFTYADLLRLPARGEMRTLVNRQHKPGGDAVGNAVWRGVLLPDLLAAAGLQSRARFVRLAGLDGYAVTLPMSMVQEVLLAYGMNGAMLPPDYGFPLLALVPGLYDACSVRWLATLTLVDQQDAQPGDPLLAADAMQPVRTFAQVMLPQPYAQVRAGVPVAIQGIAFAGARSLTAVEISLDGGDWVPANLRSPDSLHAWTQWYTLWTPQIAGSVTVAVRATDSSGYTQPFAPEGTQHAEGIHRLTLRVVAS